MKTILQFLTCLLITSACFSQKLKPAAVYTKDPKLSKEAKYFYQHLSNYKKDPAKYFSDPKTEARTKSIMDSITAVNKQLRPFYLYLALRHFEMSDGESAALSTWKQYEIIDQNPELFFQYMLDNPTEKKLYLGQSASRINDYVNGYCMQFKNMEADSCLKTLKRNVLSKLEGRPSLGVAREFFSRLISPNAEITPLVLREEDNAKTYNVSTDKPIKIILRECRGCASVWKIDESDESKISTPNVAFENPSCTNCMGGNHDRVMLFTIKQTGKTKISLSYFDKLITYNFIVK